MDENKLHAINISRFYDSSSRRCRPSFDIRCEYRRSIAYIAAYYRFSVLAANIETRP